MHILKKHMLIATAAALSIGALALIHGPRTHGESFSLVRYEAGQVYVDDTGLTADDCAAAAVRPGLACELER